MGMNHRAVQAGERTPPVAGDSMTERFDELRERGSPTQGVKLIGTNLAGEQWRNAHGLLGNHFLACSSFTWQSFLVLPPVDS